MDKPIQTTTRSGNLKSEKREGRQTIIGSAANFSSYDMGGFTESIAPNAWGDLKQYDVRALVNHDKNKLLARSKFGVGTLNLWSENGLNYEFEIPDTAAGRDTRTQLERGDISQSSWQFRIAEDGETWDFSRDKPHRTITKIDEILDVSLVTFPANPDTTAELRSLETAREKNKNLNIDIMTDAEKKELGAAAVREHVATEKIKTDLADKAKKDQEKRDKTFIDESAVKRGVSAKVMRDFAKFNPISMVNDLVAGKLTGLNAEINQEGIKEAREIGNNIETTKAAFHLPEMLQAEMRQQTVTGGTLGDEGGILVAEEFSRWVNFLFPDTPVLNLCQKFDNLVGDQLYPTEETVPALVWGTEIGAATSQESTFGTVPSSPERARILMGYSNRLLAQEHSRGLQNRLFNQMNNAFNTGIEEALIAGTGANNIPLGIMTANAGNELVTGVLSHAKLIAFELALANVDALRGNLAYVTSQNVRAWLKAALADAGSGTYLATQTRLNEVMSSNGYPVHATTAFPQFGVGPFTEGMIFGNFDDVSLDMWGSPIVTVNPYTRMAESVVEIYTERQMNVTIHRLASFATADDIVETV